MRLKVYSKAPAPRHVQQIITELKKGGVVVLPTDSVYCYAVDASHPGAIARLARIKGVPVEKANFSFLFSDLTMLGNYTRQVNNTVYKIMNRLLPGPFTFILNASTQVGKIIPNKKTIGIRVPNNNIPLDIIRELGNPLLTTSVYDDDAILEYTTDPDLIAQRLEDEVDLIVDGGYGHNEPSTVLDCTGDEVVMIRKGLGAIEELV